MAVPSAARALFLTRKTSHHVLEEEEAPGAREAEVGPAALGGGGGKAHTKVPPVAETAHRVLGTPRARPVQGTNSGTTSEQR